MQIGGQDMNDLRHDLPRRAVFLDGVPRRDNVTVMQMKAGSADLDFSRLVRSAGILSVFQDADGGPLRALNHIRWRPCLCGRTWRGTCQERTQASALSHDDHEMILSLYEADAAQYNKL